MSLKRCILHCLYLPCTYMPTCNSHFSEISFLFIQNFIQIMIILLLNHGTKFESIGQEFYHSTALFLSHLNCQSKIWRGSSFHYQHQLFHRFTVKVTFIMCCFSAKITNNIMTDLLPWVTGFRGLDCFTRSDNASDTRSKQGWHKITSWQHDKHCLSHMPPCGKSDSMCRQYLVPSRISH